MTRNNSPKFRPNYVKVADCRSIAAKYRQKAETPGCDAATRDLNLRIAEQAEMLAEQIDELERGKH